MNPGLFSILGGVDAQEIKTAASVNTLISGVKRLNPIRVPVNKPGILGQSASRGGTHLESKSRERAVAKLYHEQPIGPDPLDNARGHIFLPRGGGSSSRIRSEFERYPPNTPSETSTLNALQNLSGDGHKAVNAVIAHHEGFERGVKPNEIHTFSSHVSPKVLLNEHNLLSKMTGPGSDEARNVFRNLRDNPQEFGDIKSRMSRLYGPRSLQFLQEGEKVPKAMRNNFSRSVSNSTRSQMQAQADEQAKRLAETHARINARVAEIEKRKAEQVALGLTDKLAAAQSQPQHDEFLDGHFSLNPQWKTFKKKLRSKTFVEAVRQDLRADDKLKRYSEANSKHVQARGVPTFPVQSFNSNKRYSVKYHPDIERFSCNCGDWVHARSHQTGKTKQDCKHIGLIRSQLDREGKNPDDLVKKAAIGKAALRLLAELG